MNEKEPVNLVTPPIAVSSNAHISTMDAYQKEYQRSVDDPEGFWSEVAENFH
jgi:acetyl-CoA synthetase